MHQSGSEYCMALDLLTCVLRIASQLQEEAWKHAESRQAALDADFRADTSDEEEFGEASPMLERADSAAIRAKLSFEEPGQSGLQVKLHLGSQFCRIMLLGNPSNLALGGPIVKKSLWRLLYLTSTKGGETKRCLP